jgi:hypothetical protein
MAVALLGNGVIGVVGKNRQVDVELGVLAFCLGCENGVILGVAETNDGVSGTGGVGRVTSEIMGDAVSPYFCAYPWPLVSEALLSSYLGARRLT